MAVKKKEVQNIHQIDLYGLLKSNFYDYGMNVIEDRALPDVRDGLKPVHRAIIFEMLNSRITSKNKPVKVAKITGAVIGNWHPHGDSSVEEALAGLAVPWKNTLPTIFIKGNQGSVFGDGAAAGRYIEARLQPAGDAYGYRLKKGIVPYVPNFDNTAEMPTILPAQLPYLLINGISDGIAVGVASALPPHNAKEVLAMVLQYLKKPKTSTAELLEIMPGPDFPTGATIINKDDLYEMYKTGYGKITVRSTVVYDKSDHSLHVKEIPFSFSGSMNNLVADLVSATTETLSKSKKKVPPKITGVNSVVDYSGKDGIDIAIELQRGIDPEQMLQTLYAKTRLETTVKFNFQALNDRQLNTYTLRKYLTEYADFQHEIVTNEHTLEQADLERQLEIIMGRIVALSLIDEIVDVVKHSHGRPSIKDVLMNGTILEGTNKKYHKTVSGFKFTELQAESISGMPLYQLNRLDGEKLEKDGKDIQKRLIEVTRIIEDKKWRHKLIIKRLQAEYDALPDVPRKTIITNDEPSRTSTLETPTIPLYLGMDKYGYVRLEGKTFEDSIQTDNKSRVGFFDNEGNCWNLFLDRTKETKGRGTLISQLIETTNSVVGITSKITPNEGNQGLFIYTHGAMKRCDMSKFNTKTRATKVNTRTSKDLTLKGFYDIPADVNVVVVDGKKYPLQDIPLQSPSGSGKVLLDPKEEPEVVSFAKSNKLPTQPTIVEKNTTFDAVVVFDGSDTCVLDWSTIDTSTKEGLYVTTYQELVKSELLFVHDDGTAKRVDGRQFEVKTKRQTLQSDKTGLKSIYINKIEDDTLVGLYADETSKRIDVTKIPTQGKVGGGARVFYSPKHTLQSVISGKDSDLPVVSFATQPK